MVKKHRLKHHSPSFIQQSFESLKTLTLSFGRDDDIHMRKVLFTDAWTKIVND